MLFFFARLFSLFAGSGTDLIHVLYLNSYDQRMSWSREILRGIETELDPDHNNIILHIENMDTKEFNTPEYYQSFLKFIRNKYRETAFSLILSSDNNAFDFLRENHDSLYPSVPVVFCGVNDFEDWMIDGHPDFTGVAEIFSAETTAELALRLHPETEEIYVVNDYLVTGRAWRRDLEQRLKYLETRVKISYSEDLPLLELMEKISSLSEKTIIILGAYYSDRNGRFFTYEKSGELIVSASKVPVYTLAEFTLPSGTIGGEVIWGFTQGQKIVEIGKRILNGADPGNIPVVKKGLNRFIFNYPQLNEFNIPLSELPGNSLILNRPVSVYEQYQKEFLFVLFMIILLLFISFILLFTVIRKNQAEVTLRELAEATWEGIVIHQNGVALQFNKVFLDLFGYKEEEIRNRYIIDMIFASESLVYVKENILHGETTPYEALCKKKDGTVFPVEIRLRIIRFRGQNVRVAAIRDLTEQKKIEERVSQSQKLQAIGTLAGGVAHDFNNILGAVVGYADLGVLKSDPNSDMQLYFDRILKAGNRAKELTNQILAFSRQGNNKQAAVNFSLIIKETTGMLRASLPSSIRIEEHINTASCVLSDPTQLQQIVMNLCTNAGLAMKESGGVIIIKLNDITLKEKSTVSVFTLEPGEYAQLTVKDTGCGMSDDVRERIFEPFFTTREPGEGTGLGLSVVHGLVSSLSGAISVESGFNTGTTFTVYIPRCSEEIVQEGDGYPGLMDGGKERILFVDDEETQVLLANEFLGTLGYNVTGLTSSRDALEIFKANPANFDLLITDVSMPDLPGDLLVEEIRKVREDLPILMCTGFTTRLSGDKLTRLGVSHVISKPFMLRDLAEKIRSALK